MDNQIEKAVRILNTGGIIIFPTDTVFGIGCRMDNANAIKRLFEIRKRPKTKPVPVLVSSVDMARKYLTPIPKDVKEKLIDKFWPGPLTIILPCKTNLIPSLVRGGGKTLGVRMPGNKTILEIIEKLDIPLLGPSANFSNRKTPYDISELDPELVKKVDFILEGKTKSKKASTVIDCSKKPWKILREGVIRIHNLEETELTIDTASSEYILVGLKIGGRKYFKKQKMNFQKAQAILPIIKKILKEHKLSLQDLTSIKVNQGPGSFTGIRVGLSVANTLSHFLKIPINNKSSGKIIEPIYK
ncbi:MAG: hypothetical protein A2W22_06465 [Candidatus Levybacteria bacterium RBG_16_35_11]|nr:MAG: hypothetical protein A2W22_06465 [Candidatus Levybacteria bacterium RBG_16_35_11]